MRRLSLFAITLTATLTAAACTHHTPTTSAPAAVMTDTRAMTFAANCLCTAVDQNRGRMASFRLASRAGCCAKDRELNQGYEQARFDCWWSGSSALTNVDVDAEEPACTLSETLDTSTALGARPAPRPASALLPSA